MVNIEAPTVLPAPTSRLQLWLRSCRGSGSSKLQAQDPGAAESTKRTCKEDGGNHQEDEHVLEAVLQLVPWLASLDFRTSRGPRACGLEWGDSLKKR